MFKLVFDFDKTLIKEDSLIFSFMNLSFSFKIYIFFYLVIYGKVKLKKYLYNTNLMNFDLTLNKYLFNLLIEKNGIVVSGAYESFLKDFFSNTVKEKIEIFGTKKTNLTGRNKMNFLVKKFGYQKFDYIGDSFSDICIWKAANCSYSVRRVWLYRFFVPNLKHINEIL